MNNDNGNTNSNDTTDATVSPANAEQVRELFAAYDRAELDLQNANNAAANAIAARSDLVAQIAKLVSPLKRVIRGGKELTIVSRGDTHFLRGSKNKASFEV